MVIFDAKMEIFGQLAHLNSPLNTIISSGINIFGIFVILLGQFRNLLEINTKLNHNYILLSSQVCTGHKGNILVETKSETCN